MFAIIVTNYKHIFKILFDEYTVPKIHEVYLR